MGAGRYVPCGNSIGSGSRSLRHYLDMGQITSAMLAASCGLPVIAAYFSPRFWQIYQIGKIQRRAVNNRMLALTYDDGPSSTLTPQLLDLLRRRDVHATFFILGCHAEKFPEIVDRVVQEGHGIGCHSDQHLNAWKTMPWRAIADIDAGYERLSRWMPSDAMFRPPYGKMTLPTFWSLRLRRAPVWWWSIDSCDTHQVRKSTKQVSALVRAANGGVVLMHDGAVTGRTKEQNDFVLELTDVLLDLAQQESLKVVTLRDLSR